MSGMAWHSLIEEIIKYQSFSLFLSNLIKVTFALWNLLFLVTLQMSEACDVGQVIPTVSTRLTVEQSLTQWTDRFQQAGVPEPLLSSEYIISHVLGHKTVSPWVCVNYICYDINYDIETRCVHYLARLSFWSFTKSIVCDRLWFAYFLWSPFFWCSVSCVPPPSIAEQPQGEGIHTDALPGTVWEDLETLS